MQKDIIKHNDQTFRYKLSILDVISRFLILRPLKRKESGQIGDELLRKFSQNMENRRLFSVIKVLNLKEKFIDVR